MTYCEGKTYTGQPCPYRATKGTKCGIHYGNYDLKNMQKVLPFMFK